MERTLTVLQVNLYHPTLGPTAFANVPQQLQHDTSPLLVGRGQVAHLQLQLPQLSRYHLSLEPYVEKGGTLLAFYLKVLSRKSCVWVNGLPLRYLEQVPLSAVNKISFSNIQMVVHIEGGTSLEAFLCFFHLSPSPLIYRPRAEETDEWEGASPGFGGVHSRSSGDLLWSLPDTDSCLKPNSGGGTEIRFQREPQTLHSGSSAAENEPEVGLELFEIHNQD